MLKSINWIDVAMAVVFFWIILRGVKGGFLSEFFKLLGTLTAVFVSLHYFTVLALKASTKTGTGLACWEFAVFAVLWISITVIFKFFRLGILLLFKVETNHEGFDKYAAGVLAVARGLLVCSLALYLVLLTNNGFLTRMTLHSYSFKITGRAAVNTYTFIYNELVGKLFTGAQYNSAAAMVLQPEGKAPKARK